MYQLIFIGLFVTGWLLCAYIPWLVLSVATKGNAGLVNLPLCLLAGVAGGFAVPFLVLDDANGIWLSFLAAVLLPALVLAARRFAAPARERQAPAPDGPVALPTRDPAATASRKSGIENP